MGFNSGFKGLINNYDRKIRVSFKTLNYFYILLHIIIYLKYRMVCLIKFDTFDFEILNRQSAINNLTKKAIIIIYLYIP